MNPLYLREPNVHPTAFIAPGAHIYGNVEVGSDAVVMFGSVIRAEFDRIVVGARTNIQDGVVVHEDEGMPCLIGSDVVVGHMAVVHGARVSDHCLVGIGSKLLNNSELGDGAWLAAGAVLTEGHSIPPWTLAVGIPAKPIRELTESEITRQSNGVKDYQRIAEAYRKLFA